MANQQQRERILNILLFTRMRISKKAPRARASFQRFSAISAILIILTALSAQYASATSVSTPADCKPAEPNQAQQFEANGSAETSPDLIWMVDGVKGGAPAIGTITNTGLYTAPANMDEAVNVTITAVSAKDDTELANIKLCNAVYSRAGATYFVATTGADSNAGTQSAPWRTIQHAVDQVQAGDSVIVRGGIYNETVTINKSGSAEKGFITLEKYSGENAIIDGTGLATQPTGMRGLISLNNASYIRIKGFEIRNYKSATEFIAIGILAQGSGERIEIRNTIIHAIEANNLPENGNANALGIAVYGQTATPIRNVIIDGNELFGLKTGTSESLTIGGNVEGWQITNNLVHDNNFIGIDATGYYNNPAEYNRARNGWIAGNTVYNLSTAGNQALTFAAAAIGIYVDGGRDITIERNDVFANDGGIWLLSEQPGKATENIIARNNIIRLNRDAGILAGGYDATGSGGIANTTITGNTLSQNNTRDVAGIHAGEFQIGHNVKNIKFGSNRLSAGSKGYVITKFAPAEAGSVTLSDNIYYTLSGSELTRWFWSDTNYYNDGSTANDFSAFKAISGDSGSVVNNPETVQTPQAQPAP